jgi:hypothetical protein
MPTEYRETKLTDPELIQLKGRPEDHILAMERALLKLPFIDLALRSELNKLGIITQDEYETLKAGPNP